MNKNFRQILCIAACVLAASCAKTPTSLTNGNERLAFESRALIHYGDRVIDTTAFGVFIIEDIKGDGEAVSDSNYLFIRYICRDMATGTILEYTDAAQARQLGAYSKCNYYSDRVLPHFEGSTVKGLMELVAGGKKTGKMHAGGTRTALIPGWLLSTSVYKTPQEYMQKVTGQSDYQYTMTINGQTKDITKWQIDTIKRYMEKMHLNGNSKSGEGFFYCKTKDPVKQTALPTDTTVYINYTGRLLNGQVFDTTIKDTAKVWGIYSESSSYAPVSIATAADSTAFTMSSSSVIKGFSLTVYNMHAGEKGVGIFTSDYGYGSSASGLKIPPYAPLVFEIELVPNPNL